ncbi:MAG: hypothetical protein ACOCY6_05535, partial [Halodesulfurarchaeum sp.]
MTNISVVLSVVVLLIVSSMSVGFAATDAALADDESALIGFTADVQPIETVGFEPPDHRANSSEFGEFTNGSDSTRTVPGLPGGQNSTNPGPALGFPEVAPEAQNDSAQHNRTGHNETADPIENATNDRPGSGESSGNRTVVEPGDSSTGETGNDSVEPVEPRNATTGSEPTAPGSGNDTASESGNHSPDGGDNQLDGAPGGEDSEPDETESDTTE